MVGFVRLKNDQRDRGVTLVEVIITLVIIGILAGTFIVTWMGSRTSDDIDRTTQRIYDDVVAIRSRAVSTNILHRINFTADNTWQLELWDDGTSAWVTYGEAVRTMPSTVNATAATFAVAGANLEADTSGLYSFQGTLTGDPYITIEGSGYSYTKSVIVAVGGAVEFETN